MKTAAAINAEINDAANRIVKLEKAVNLLSAGAGGYVIVSAALRQSGVDHALAFHKQRGDRWTLTDHGNILAEGPIANIREVVRSYLDGLLGHARDTVRDSYIAYLDATKAPVFEEGTTDHIEELFASNNVPESTREGGNIVIAAWRLRLAQHRANESIAF